jgi:transposase-like protein
MGESGCNAEKAAFWRLAVSEQRVGGLSVSAFCAREGLTASNFYAWRRRLAQRDAEGTMAHASPAFVELTPGVAKAMDFGELSSSLSLRVQGGRAAPIDRDAASLELVLAGGVLVRVRDGFNASLLRRVVEALS